MTVDELVAAVFEALDASPYLCWNCSSEARRHGEETTVLAVGYATDPAWAAGVPGADAQYRVHYCDKCLGSFGSEWFYYDGTRKEKADVR